MDLQIALEHRAQVEEFRRRHRTGLLTLLFTDIIGSTAIKQALGDREGVALIQQHRLLVRDLLSQFKEAEEIETAGDSFFIVFVKPSDAVRFSLLLQARLRDWGQAGPHPVRLRIGIHIGEVVIEEHEGKQKPKDLYGIQVDTCARVMSLAGGDQILLTRSAFDNARQVLKGEDIGTLGELAWLNYGPYLIKGLEEPMEICEVGEVGQAPLTAPADAQKAQRQVSPDSEPVLGWRPALDQVVPNTQWVLEKKLGEGGFGEVWLGRHRTLKERRVFKFCFRADRVRSLKREMTLFRVLKERVGDHPNIVRLLEVYFEEPPFYVVMDYVEGKDLRTWSEERESVGSVPLDVKLEIVAQIADALQAAHDAGVIHRDVKPGNILVSGQWLVTSGENQTNTAERSSAISSLVTRPSSLSVKLTDFGIGQVVSEEALKGVTKAGFTETIVADSSSSQTGSQMYMAPELLAGKPASTHSDIYSLGVVLYQLLVGDLTRPLTTDWADHIADPLLRDDLKHCFAGNPQDRFAGAGQLAKNLRALLQRQAAHAARRAEQAAREKAAYRRGVLRTAALATVLVVTLAGLALVALKKSREAALARERAEETARKLWIDNYAADMKVVQAAISENNRGRVVEVLQKYRPKPGEEDLRGLEWRYLWRQAQGDEVYTFREFGGHVGDAIFSPIDQRLLATVEENLLDQIHTVKVWDVASKQLVFKFAGKVREGVPGSGSLIAFSPDGKNLAAILGNSVTIWETDRWQVLTNLEGALQSLVYSPDGKILAACVDGGVRLWDTANWRTNLLPTGLKAKAWAFAAISPDSSLLATAESRQPIQLWDLASLSKIVELKSPSGWIVSLAFSPTENLLAAADWEGVLRIWDLATRRQVVTNATRASFIDGMAFSPDGKTLALAAGDQTIRLLDVATQKPLANLRGHLKEVWKVAYSPDGKYLASASKDGTVRLWNAAPKPEAADSWNDPIGTVFRGIERGAGLLMYSSTNQPVEFWKVADGKAAKSFSLNIEPEDRWHVRCSPDGRLAAIGRTNGVIELYDCASARLLKPLKVGEDLFVPLAISADKRLVALNRTKDSTLSVWDLEAGTHIFTLQAYDSPYGDIPAIFSPNGRLLAYKGPQFSIQLREIASGRELTLKGHSWSVNTLNFSQDGKLLVSTSIDDEAKIWDVTTGRQFAPTLKGHTQGLRFAQFTPDGRTVLTTDQRTVRFWNVINGQEMVAINDAGDFMLAADGNTLVLRTIDGKRRFMRIPTLAEIDAVEKANAK